MVKLGTKTEATLGGKELIGGAAFSWPLRDGVQPVVKSFVMAPDDALNLKQSQGPHTLIITPPEGAPTKVEFLYITDVKPGINPWESKITVADRRYWWSYPHITRHFNIRRSTGTKRILSNDTFAVPFDRADDVQFWTWSLFRRIRRFVPLTALLDIFKELADAEDEAFGNRFKVKVEDTIGSKIAALPFENVHADLQGDAALHVVLNYLRGSGVYVDYDGTVIVYDKTTGREKEIVKALMPELWNQGHVDLVANENIRPREIHVLFTRHVEVRFDFIESTLAMPQGAGTTIASDQPSPLGKLRRMENVLPISDYQLSVSSVDANQPLCQGNWITFDQAFQSWGNLPIDDITPRPLDHDLMQIAFIPHMDLWTALGIAGNAPDANDNNELKPWIGRIAECEANYRQTFRINTEFRDRMLHIAEYRVSTINPQTGQRAPSRAYGDYCVMHTQRTKFKNAAQGKPLNYAINRSAFPDDTVGGDAVIHTTLDSQAEPSPAIVEITDNDQGIIRFNYVGKNPRTGDSRMILPSKMVADSISDGGGGPAMPTARIADRRRPITFDTIIDANNPPRLSPDFKAAVVLTCVPASPNTDQQLHRIKIKPSQVADLLPEAAKVGLGNAKGPIMEIRIGSNIEVARVQWLDKRATDIERCFGLENGEETDTLPDLTDMVINEGDSTDLRTGGSINLIARAAAARVWAQFVDRYEGTMTGYMNGNVKLTGWAEEVIQEYGADSEAYTHVTFPSEVPQMPLAAFLDANTRAAVYRLVKPENA